MKTLPGLYTPAVAPRSLRQRPTSLWADALCLALGLIALALIWHGVAEMRAPLAVLDADPMTLDLARLPEYALRTTLRMFIALGASLLFTFVFATLAAKSRKAELLILPAIDILQSVPILGFLTFTVSFFLGLFPGRQLGAECAAIFAIFTSQAWNMAFGFYQSLRTVPEDLQQVSRQFGLSPWRRFFRLELPFAIPGLVWNTMMSMSGGWFFVVASEAITVGDNTVNLPGIGSWLALAIARQDIAAIGWAVLAMGLVILVYDQLFFRPVVAWADRFRVEQTASQQVPRSWVYDLVRRARLGRMLGGFGSFCTQLATPRIRRAWPHWHLAPQGRAWLQRGLDVLWYGALLVVLPYGVYALYRFIAADVYWVEAVAVLGLGLLTMARVLLLIAVASLIWVPIGVWIGLRPGWSQRLQAVAQFLAAFPAGGGRSLQKQTPQSRHLAVAADGAGHPVVHPVQRHRRRQRAAQRPARSGPAVRPQALAVVAAAGPAGDLSLLRHRRPDRRGRFLERQHRRRGGELGQRTPAGPWPGRLHRADDHRRRLPPGRPGHRGDVDLRTRIQPAALAAPVCLCRTAPAARLRGEPP